MTDSKVNHPSHYNTGKIEVIDAIEDWKLGFHEGNVVKYVARAKHKGSELEDLRKAAWYLNRAIENIELREGLSPMRGVHARIEFVPIVHAYFSQNYAGTACGGEPGPGSEIDSEVTCQRCSAWIKRGKTFEWALARDKPPHPSEVRTIHIVFSKNNIIETRCGLRMDGAFFTTDDPEAATCIKCKELAK